MENNRPLGLANNTSTIGVDLFSTLFFLFFIQHITFLIESIYMLNLLHTSLDSKALGVLLLFLPVFLVIINHSKVSYAVIGFLMLFCTLLSPLLPTPMRILSSGLGAGLFLLYLGLYLSDLEMPQINWGKAAALATLTSIAFRAAGHSLDISTSGNTKLIGWILTLIAAFLFYRLIKKYSLSKNSVVYRNTRNSNIASLLNILGFAGSILLIYFALSSPGVIARWTEGNYIGIHIVLCISLSIFIVFRTKLQFQSQFKNILTGWNFVFVLLLITTILFHRVPFPVSPESTPQVVGEPGFISQLVTYSMLALSPVVFINIGLFSRSLESVEKAKLAGSFLLGILLMVLVIFMLIFSNVWGYIKPISTIFRNQFYISFFFAGMLMLIPHLFIKRNNFDVGIDNRSSLWSPMTAIFLVILCLGSVLGRNGMHTGTNNATRELTLMTYNIQQGVDLFGNKNYAGQLELIKEVDPDILCLQESDGSRISGGNSDVVRYFSEKLVYYSYYGPTTVTGTFGTAILSRFPLDSCRTIFTFSNKDEIGTAVAEITVAGQNITIVNSHPAGNAESRMAHIDAVIDIAKKSKFTIAPGDYNFREDSPYYELITDVMNNAWQMLYPDAIGPVDTNRLDLSFKNRKGSGGQLLPGGRQDMKGRIDHIFLSKKFEILEAHYLPAPESGTDHPAHWATVRW